MWSPIAVVESTFFWPQLTGGNTFVGNGTSGSSGPLDQQLTHSNDMFIVGPRRGFRPTGSAVGRARSAVVRLELGQQLLPGRHRERNTGIFRCQLVPSLHG